MIVGRLTFPDIAFCAGGLRKATIRRRHGLIVQLGFFKVTHIWTVHISKLVTDRVNINVAINYKVEYGLPIRLNLTFVYSIYR